MPDASPNPSDTSHADVGIVHATSIELAPFLDRCDRVRKYLGGGLVFRLLRNNMVGFYLAGGPDGATFSVGGGWAF